MARKVKTGIENNFIRGLITETTELKFPDHAATEAMDTVFSNTGRVTRRPGFDFEAGHADVDSTHADTSSYSEFLWVNATGSGDTSLAVVQVDNTIQFYAVEDDLVISTRLKSFRIDLLDHVPAGSSLLPKDYLCSYSQGRGSLIIVNKAITPIRIRYSATSDDITVNDINIKIRDFAGVDDGLTLTERVAVDLADLKATHPNHYYNLLNQGWHAVDALTQWDAARSDMPSNADITSLFRASDVDAFDASRVLAKSPGNTPAPKGHFILDAFNPDRTQAMIDEGFTGAEVSGASEVIAHNIGTAISDNVASQANAFDNTSAMSVTGAPGSGGSGLYLPAVVAEGVGRLGKDFGAGNPKSVKSVTVYGTSDIGFLYGTSSVTFTLKASDTNPVTNSWIGTSLGSVTFSNTTNESSGRSITSSDPTTQYRYFWIEFAEGASRPELYVTEIRFFTEAEVSVNYVTYVRPTFAAHFAGRVFYAGVENPDLNNNVYFTQIIENDDQYEQCYSVNDPTAESFSDPLATDGGVINIIDIAKVTGLFTYQNALIIFATNGVWLIQGGSGSGFRSSDYSVRKISSMGTNSSKSIVDYRGLPVWWGEDGINTIDYQSNYDSYSVTSLTFDTIRAFYYAIPVANRQHVKGYYDVINTRISWLYSTTEDGRVYNRILNFNPLTKAFYPWSISVKEDNSSYPNVRGGLYLFSTSRTTDSKVKFITTYDNNLTFSEYITTPADWITYADGDDSLVGEFESYFITGYKNNSETNKDSQVNYLSVFIGQEFNGSCYVQIIGDYTTIPSSGRWGVRQRVYANPVTDSTIAIRRLKVRGTHKAYQFKFRSEGRNPFTLIGWTTAESSNSNV